MHLSCVGYILRSLNPTFYTVLLSGGLLWIDNTASVFLTMSEGLWSFILLALCAPPPQKPCSQCSTGFLLRFSLSRRLSLLRLDSMPCLVGALYLHFTILEDDPVAPMNINYHPAEYCISWGFHYLIPSRDDWNPNTSSPRKSWIYIPTTLNSIIWLEAMSTLGN